MYKVKTIEVNEHKQGQRIDNYLISMLKGVPKTRIYRAIRKGEVRVNKKRIKASYRVQDGDLVRIPPLNQGAATAEVKPSLAITDMLKGRILYEDEDLLIINKPSGIPVHGGSHQIGGVIEYLRQIIDSPYIELAHRLDKDTSGCLVLAKKSSVLKELHELMRNNQVKKSYLALVMGAWPKSNVKVDLPLRKNQLASGERIVSVNESGREAITLTKAIQYLDSSTLLQAELVTGRTHQIRVHCTASGHPIAGDSKYGDKAFNRLMHNKGLKRMFLHAKFISFKLSTMDKIISVSAPLDEQLQKILENLEKKR